MLNSTWIKDAFFVVVVLGGIAAVAAGMLTTDRIEPPRDYAPHGTQRTSIASVVDRIDAAFEADWQRQGLSVAESAQTLQVARRLGLGLAGTIPSLEEIRALEQQPEEDQIFWWVSRLLQDERTGDFLAERFARAMLGVEEGPFLIYRRRRFVSWLSDSIMENRRYDHLVREILTDEGLWTDTPAVNFYTRAVTEDNQSQPDPIWLAGRTSRVFLGMRIDCLQCHDDFLGNINLGSPKDPSGGTQVDFHSLAAFFADTENSLLGIRDNPQRDAYQYRLLDESEESVIEPAVPFLSELDDGQGNLRGRLARWVTHPDNRAFARATVNRIWAIMTGQGLMQPVDDIPIDGPFPEPMEILVDDLIENNFDLHRLIHIISQTRSFQLDSAADFAVSQDHLDHGAVFPMVRLRPDQAAGAIAQSTQISTIDATSHIITRLTRYGQQNDFVQRFGDPGENEFEDRGETVTQRLLMLNGNMIAERLQNELNSCAHVAGLSPNPETAVEVVYLSTLTRRPTETERKHFAGAVSEKYGNERKRELIDLYWSLMNSAEFRWNH